MIFALTRTRRAALVPVAVGASIAGAYRFTSSTSFANPAVSIARMFSDTFAGISPGSVLPFLVAQVIGTGAAILLLRYLVRFNVEDDDLQEKRRADNL